MYNFQALREADLSKVDFGFDLGPDHGPSSNLELSEDQKAKLL